MIEQRLIAAGGMPIAAKVVAALSLACLMLGLLLGLSVYINVQQHRGAASMALKLGGQLAASEARGAAELQACGDTNARVNQTVQVLGDELHQCRGQQQDMAGDLALAFRQRDRARRAVTAEIQQRQTTVQLLVERNESCAPRALCRAVSDQLLGAPADRPAE